MTTIATSSAPPVTLSARYGEVRRLTEELAAPLSAEDQTVQSMPDVSPTKWHRAHTTWFFETFLLQPSVRDYRPFDAAYAYLFNSYYEGVGERHARHERGLVSRPGIDDIARYRSFVDDAMSALLRDIDTDRSDTADLVELGLHHEQQHQELLLMDIKHVLWKNPTRPAYCPMNSPTGFWARSVPHSGLSAPKTTSWTAHEGGVVEIGHDGDGFAFDNESPRHDVLLRPFAITERPVTAGEWLAFLDDGGYSRPELWLSEGWAAIHANGWDAPLYWERHGGGWQVFTLQGLRPLDPGEPVVHVSYFEADAFARWAGARLPVEAEWEALAASGALRQLGDVWEWTSSAYSPYPGFRPAPGAVGEYNGKFMVNQYVLRGGCCATPPGHARATYRNFFPASARWAFSGMRLARDGS